MTKKIKKTKTVSSSASEIGRLGGLAVAKKRGKKYMKEIGKKGAIARWGQKSNKEK